jgi:hypothetical protein
MLAYYLRLHDRGSSGNTPAAHSAGTSPSVNGFSSPQAKQPVRVKLSRRLSTAGPRKRFRSMRPITPFAPAYRLVTVKQAPAAKGLVGPNSTRTRSSVCGTSVTAFAERNPQIAGRRSRKALDCADRLPPAAAKPHPRSRSPLLVQRVPSFTAAPMPAMHNTRPSTEPQHTHSSPQGTSAPERANHKVASRHSQGQQPGCPAKRRAPTSLAWIVSAFRYRAVCWLRQPPASRQTATTPRAPGATPNTRANATSTSATVQTPCALKRLCLTRE